MARIQDKLSQLVGTQLPEFIRADYATFRAFIEAYYRYLEQDQYSQELLQNARSYNDIDTTIDSFISYFIKQYADKLPNGVLADKKLLVKKINDLYTAKGSETGYKLLFQLLYGKQVDVFYPSTLILKASSGDWRQKTSFFVRVIFGDITDITDRICNLQAEFKNITIKIVGKEQTTIISNGVFLTTNSDVYELFYDNLSNPSIDVGDILVFTGFRAQVLATPNRINIVQGGTGFKVGDVFPIDTAEGTGVQVKVTKVGTGGSIEGLQFLTYGVGYPPVFFHYQSKSGASQANLIEYFSSFITGGVAHAYTFREKVGDVGDDGTLNLHNYTINGFDATYCGEVVGTFSYSPSITSTPNNADVAILQITTGAKTTYPGYYRTTDGFLSDEYALEDADYYMPFSYVLRIDEQLKNYKKAVLQILHPAGTKLHGDYRIHNDVDILTEVTSKIGFILNDFSDTFVMEDGGIIYSMTKPLSDVHAILDNYAASVSKPLANIFTISDTSALEVTKSLANAITIADSYSASMTKQLKFTEYAIDYFLEDANSFYTEPTAGEDLFVIEDTITIVI